jgi:hypothetical protein
MSRSHEAWQWTATRRDSRLPAPSPSPLRRYTVPRTELLLDEDATASAFKRSLAGADVVLLSAAAREADPAM